MFHNWDSRSGDDSTAGGFLNSTTNQADTPAKKGGPKRHQSVVPVVIRQILDCPEEEFKLFGMNTQILQLVGILKEYEVQSTKATYTIEDHTGRIKAIWWLENDSDNTLNLPTVKEGSYVQVFGSLRNKDQDKFIMVLRMYLIEDCNVVTNHLLQVIHTRLAAEKLSKTSDIQIRINNPGASLMNSMSTMDDNMSDNITSEFTPLQQKLFKILQTSTSAAGMERSAILRNFQTSQHREVNDALEYLINEGHAYSTIDNDHFKTTNV